MRRSGRYRLWATVLALLPAFALMLAPGAFAGARALKADTVLVNGKVITVDANDSIARAVAIKDGRIIAVGTRNEIRRYITARTTVIDLHGRTATPGMIDSHVHFSGTAALYSLDLGPLNVRNVADVQAMVRAQCDFLGPGQWVQGRGWGAAYLEEQRPLYAADLDPVSPNNPVFLRETSGHQAVANSYALALAGIDANTPDPPGGIIDRYPDGTPTGLLKESATRLVAKLIPPYTEEQQRQGLRYICRMANSVGLTAILYPGIGDSTWNLFQEAEQEGALTVRSAMLWHCPDDASEAQAQALIDKIRPITHPHNKDSDMLWSQGIKMFCDGVQDASTHWSWQEHWVSYWGPVNTGWYGAPVWSDPNHFRRIVRMFHDAGLQVQVHCCGDRAADWTLESYKVALEENPIYGLRHGIIHWDLPTDWALATAPVMQRTYDAGYCYTNPVFMWWTEIIANSMGPFMSLREMPLKTYGEIGLLYGFGSDYSVDPLDPKYSIWSAMTRDTLMGVFGPHPFGLDECIDVRAALRAMTRSNAYLLFMEDEIGSIEVGKYADIAVWDKDWYTATTDEIFDIECEMTLLGGKTVFMAEDTPITVSQGRCKGS